MPECYLCQSTEFLSVKHTRRNGTKAYICRTCRNAAYKKYMEKTKGITKPVKSNNEKWEQLSRESMARIEAKYAKA